MTPNNPRWLDAEKIIKALLEGPEQGISRFLLKRINEGVFDASPAPVGGLETLANWMMAHGFATGHGESIEDLLGELDWQIKELRPASQGWIAVSERLPDKHQSVALMDIERFRNCPFELNIYDCGYLEGEIDGVWFWSIRGKRAQVIKAYSHWMPLPERPA